MVPINESPGLRSDVNAISTDIKQDSASWRIVLVLVVAMFLAFALYLALFSELGFGATLFKALMKTGRLYIFIAGAGFLLLVCFYIVDFDVGVRALNYLIFALIATCMVFGAVLCFGSMPHAPLMAFMVTSTAYFAAIYHSLFRDILTPEAYVRALSAACLTGGAAAFLASCIWAGINYCWWGEDCKALFRDRLRLCTDMSVGPESHCKRYGTWGVTCPSGCKEDEKLSACKVGTPDCLAAFMLWASPFLMSFLVFLFGGAMHFVAGSAKEAKSGEEQKSTYRLQSFGRAMLFLVLLLWLGASIAGANMQLSNVIVSFAFLGLLLVAVIMAVAFGGRKMQETLMETKFVKLATQDPFWSNVGRGLALFVCGPVFLAFLPVASLKRSIRKCRSSPDVSAPIVEGGSSTAEGRPFKEVAAFQLIKDSRSWPWTTVLSYAWMWGFAYFAMQAIVMTMTTLFMAWLNIQLAGMHVAVISVVIVCIALVLFAIPVVPGVPAYLACGVIIGNTEKEVGSFGLTLVIAIAVALLSKQLACLMQQKVFGELMGKSLWVRSTLGVNQPTMKAINLILQEKGLTAGKVAILVGGPDWPTSVLTGVLRLPALQMQIGTLPVSVPILFIVLTGTAMLKSGQAPDSLWGPLSGVFVAVSGMLQVSIGLLAVKYVNQCTKERAADIEGMANDPEVEEFDRSQEKAIQDKEAAMRWEEQSTMWRAILIASVATITISGWIFKNFKCFEDVVLTTDVYAPPFNGNFLNVFKLYGWIGLGFQVFSWALYYAFSAHVAASVKMHTKPNQVAPLNQDPDASSTASTTPTQHRPGATPAPRAATSQPAPVAATGAVAGAGTLVSSEPRIQSMNMHGNVVRGQSGSIYPSVNS